MSDRPFQEAFADLRARVGISLRQLARLSQQADPAGKGLSAGHLARLEKGGERPSTAAIALLAELLGVDPEYFAEYRLSRARDRLDDRGPGGLQAALRELADIEAALGPTPPPGKRRPRRVAAA